MRKLNLALLTLLAVIVFGVARTDKYVPVIHKSLPKTVMIHTQMEEGSYLGAGVFISPTGHVLTCAHLFTHPGIKAISVTLYNDDTYEAELLAKDVKKDLALLKITPFDLKKSKWVPTEVPYARILDPRKLVVGQEVIAIGNPEGLAFSVCHGIISNLYMDIGEFYNLTQADVMINPGNSGGPLFNLDGQLVGINNLVVTVVPGLPLGTGLSFSVQSGQIIEFLSKYKGIEKSWK